MKAFGPAWAWNSRTARPRATPASGCTASPSGKSWPPSPLARELRNLLPEAALIITTGTETGQSLARKHLAPLGALVCYFPLDIPWAVRRYLERLTPTWSLPWNRKYGLISLS